MIRQWGNNRREFTVQKHREMEKIQLFEFSPRGDLTLIVAETGSIKW
ncbi:hypothetical protein J7M07_09015 [bacterium]|nr:hypothetical protein [bacterium]